MLVGQTNKKFKIKYGKFEADREAEKAVLIPLPLRGFVTLAGQGATWVCSLICKTKALTR